jgi:Tol biopolymer transport system component
MSYRGRLVSAFGLVGLVACALTACSHGGSHRVFRYPPTDREGSWARDSRTIVFASDRGPPFSGRFGLYTIRVDGTHRRKLARSSVDLENAAWAPSGTWIAYDVSPYEQAGIWGPRGIYVVRPNGRGRRRLTRGPDEGPLWSPDGSRIAFLRSLSEYNPDHLYVMNAKGGDLHRVTPKGVSVNSFGWSPDGRKLAYETLDETGIYVVSSRGGFTSAVTTDISAGAPSWSPNGREIAYLDDWPGPLIIANPDSGQARTVARDVSSYQWLPDGRGFVLERKREIELLRLKHRTIRRLAPGVAPLVSPDGKEVTFERRGQEAWAYGPQRSAVFVVNVRGDGLRSVTERRSRLSGSIQLYP